MHLAMNQVSKMNENFTHSVYFINEDEYYISKFEVIGNYEDSDQNWEAYFKRTYPKIHNKSGKVLKFNEDELLDFILEIKAKI